MSAHVCIPFSTIDDAEGLLRAALKKMRKAAAIMEEESELGLTDSKRMKKARRLLAYARLEVDTTIGNLKRIAPPDRPSEVVDAGEGSRQ